MKISNLKLAVVSCVVYCFSGCSTPSNPAGNPAASSVVNNPNLLSVVGTNESGYQYTFKGGLVCNRPAYYTKYVKTGGAIAIKSLFEAKGDFESDWKRTAQANPKFEELQSAFFDVCFEHGNGLIDKPTYEERSNKYDRIRQKLLEQGLSQDPERDIRFEVHLVNTKFFQLKGTRKVEFDWKFEPTISDSNKAITVFLGLTVIHDEEKLSETDNGDKSCAEIESCLNFKYWDNRINPIIIRGGHTSSDVSWITPIPDNVQTIRIFWEFFQLEHDMGNKCSVAAQNPKGGIPFLEVLSPSGKKVDVGCYSSSSSKVIKVAL